MSGRFVRASKYRHVFGRSTKKEQCYDNVRVTKNAWDTNLVKANPQYLSVNWESSGGGAFAVIPLSERGKLPDRVPLFRGHTAAVLDTDWSPFDDSFIASGSDDGKIFLWTVPEDFTIRPDTEDVEDIKPVSKLSGHTRKVGHVLFNPSAQNVLASASGDYTIKLWDVDAGPSSLALKHNDVIQSLSWSADGSMLVTTCRDKKLRFWDVRQQKPAAEVAGHSGAKNSRAVWMGGLDRVATTGFSKMSDRQLGLWDVRAAREPLNGFEMLDQISGVCIPFWDDGTHCLYLAGKGDGNIRYYEYENDKFEYLSQYSSPDPQRGIAFMPKRGVNMHENEVMRAFKTVSDSYIEPISFIVPRRAEVFQSDIYPPTVGTKPAMSASEWFAGKEGLPPKISLESLFEGTEEEVPGDYAVASQAKSIPATPSTPNKAEPSPAKEEPTPPRSEPVPEPTVSRGPPPSMKDNQTSIASMASKYADKESSSEDENDETSSFEEVPKPVERPKAAALAPTADEAETLASHPNGSVPTSKPSTPPPPVTAVQQTLPKAAEVSPTAHRSTPSTGSASGAGPAEGLRAHLQDIKSLLEAQNRTIIAQGAKIDALAQDVQLLMSNAKPSGSDGAKDERIRQLELELEEARS